MKIELMKAGIPKTITFCCEELANKLFYMPDCLNFLRTDREQGQWQQILVLVNKRPAKFCQYCGSKIEANV